MNNILYEIKVKYYNITDTESEADFKLLAKSREDAIRIAKQYFKAQYGNLDAEFMARAVRPNSEEIEHVKSALALNFSEIRKSFSGNTYRDFMKAFMDFGGYDFSISNISASYKVDFFGFTFEVVYKINLSQEGYYSINDSDEIVYNSKLYERNYVIKNNLMDIYVGR